MPQVHGCQAPGHGEAWEEQEKEKAMTFRKKKIPGCCPVIRCRKSPRNLSDHPNSTQLCGSHHKELWRIRNPVHAAFDNLRKHARARKVLFTLTLQHFTEIIAPTAYIDEKGQQRHCLHIDRIKTHLGYVDGNIQILTCTENVLKEHAERRQRFVDAKIRGHQQEQPVEEDEADPF